MQRFKLRPPTGDAPTVAVGPPRRRLLWMAAPGLVWWAANIGFWTLGVLDSDQRGYRAWAEGFGSFPHAVQDAVAYLAVPCWFALVLSFGALVTVEGRQAWYLVGAITSVVIIGSPAAVVVATWLYPGG